ncbi:MAG: hypothetical protein LBR38_00450 [Synergistaceae bacterium]|jgi:7-keto-8-aminopelargonate synthetase-like enzyme|nr:hypothetical protein [Synergistaceae bacterium]
MTRRRQRVDWDEEIRKTEAIRRRGLFMSLLSFAAAAAVIFGAGYMSGVQIEISRKVIFAFCLCAVLFAAKAVLSHRARSSERREQEKELSAALKEAASDDAFTPNPANRTYRIRNAGKRKE